MADVVALQVADVPAAVLVADAAADLAYSVVCVVPVAAVADVELHQVAVVLRLLVARAEAPVAAADAVVAQAEALVVAAVDAAAVAEVAVVDGLA